MLGGLGKQAARETVPSMRIDQARNSSEQASNVFVSGCCSTEAVGDVRWSG
jgi:hypothetical protein